MKSKLRPVNNCPFAAHRSCDDSNGMAHNSRDKRPDNLFITSTKPRRRVIKFIYLPLFFYFAIFTLYDEAYEFVAAVAKDFERGASHCSVVECGVCRRTAAATAVANGDHNNGYL